MSDRAPLLLDEVGPRADDALVLLLGRASALAASPWPARLGLDAETLRAMLAAARPGDAGATASTFLGTRRVVVGVLPEACSRHNSPSRAWAIPGLVGALRGAKGGVVVAHLDTPDHAAATALAVARGLPTFSLKSGEAGGGPVRLVLWHDGAALVPPRLPAAMEAVRAAAAMVDTPPELLSTTAFVAAARALAARVGADVEVIEGEALAAAGLHGVHGVGRAARRPPALVALTHRPPGATRHVGWVGKGIVYDTGGLSLKGKDAMPGMKNDMAGAAAVLQAFGAAVESGASYAITAVLCLAENAIGPDAWRPDDVVTLHSGKTVEINNTDAEGRLVLADGVSWLCRHHRPDLLVDLATLTGAQLVSTGKVMAGIVSNDEALEADACDTGRAIGEPVFPLPWAPELFRKEFASSIADMKNSVKDRNNAQSACAAWFIAAHLPADAPPWLHVDMAGPANGADGRGSGYGVGLLLGLGAGGPRLRARDSAEG